MRPGHAPVPGGSRAVMPPGGGPPGMGSSMQQSGPVYSRYDQERFRGKEGLFHIFNYFFPATTWEANYERLYHCRNGGIQN